MLKSTTRIVAVALLGTCLSLPAFAQGAGGAGSSGNSGSSEGAAGEGGSKTMERLNNTAPDPRAPGAQQAPGTTGSVRSTNCTQRWSQMRGSAMAQGMTEERFNADCMAGKI